MSAARLRLNFFCVFGFYGVDTVGVPPTRFIVFMAEHHNGISNSPLDNLVNISKIGTMGLSNAMGALGMGGMGGMGINLQGGIGVKTTRNSFKPRPLIKKVKCSLVDIYNGSKKVITIEPLITIEGKLEKVTKNITIQIDKGISNGEKISITKSGNQSLQGEVGDLDIIFELERHPIFTRDGNDLQIERDILLSEALGGYEFVLRHLDGNKYLVRHDTVIDNNTIHVIRNKGLPLRDHQSYGDLYITYKIEFPKNLEESRISLLKKILPTRTGLPEKINKLIRLDLEEVDIDSNDDDNDNEDNDNNDNNSVGGGFDFGMNLGGGGNNNQTPPCIQQ